MLFPSTTPPVKKQFRNARRRFEIVNQNNSSAENGQSKAEAIQNRPARAFYTFFTLLPLHPGVERGILIK